MKENDFGMITVNMASQKVPDAGHQVEFKKYVTSQAYQQAL